MKMMIPGVHDEETTNNEKIARMLFKKGLPVYVTNESSPRQVIFISYQDENKQTRSKNFPDSYLPLCLTDYIPSAQLAKSVDFWAYIRSGTLVPVRPREAKAILTSPDARMERDRLKSRSGKSVTKAGRTIKGFKNAPSGQIGIDTRHPDDGRGSDTEDEGPQLNRRMMHIMARTMADKQTSPRLALAEIKSIKGLSQNDLGYLVGNGTITNIEDSTSDSTITDWAMAELQKPKMTKPVGSSKKKKKKSKSRRA